MMKAAAMNMYLRAKKTPTQMIFNNSQATDKAIEDDFSGEGCDAVRERKRSSSSWTRFSSRDFFPGGGKDGRVTGSQLNISGVNGLPCGGILVHGKSNL